MKYSLPRHFNHNHIDKFLVKFGELFHQKEKRKPGVTVEGKYINQISVIGVLLLYKLMEYTVNNSCFFQPKFNSGEELNDAIERYGFTDLINQLMTGQITPKKRTKIYSQINVKFDENFIIAPHTMERDKYLSNEEFQKKYVSKIAKYYGNTEQSEMIFTCISEILLNFWEHADKDPYSILVAEGNMQKIEIACADTGNGIINTLKDAIIDIRNWDKKEVLAYAMKKNVTSKPNTFHMGRGLWILKKIALMTGGILNVYSQGASYKCVNGKEFSENCGYWDGTFVYINLPLSNPISMLDVLEEERESLDTIVLNII